jgi:hypothetical protein
MIWFFGNWLNLAGVLVILAFVGVTIWRFNE